MDKPRALVTAPLRGPALDRLHELAEVELDPWIDHRPIKLMGPEELAARVEAAGATILICEADAVKGPVLDLPISVIASTRGDPTNVDLPGATRAGIPVVHAPGRNADAVAEMTLALLFAVNRHVVAGDRDMRAGTVYGETLPYQRYRAWELAGQTAGIVGLGAVGRATQWRFAGIGMQVIVADPFSDEATHELPELLAQADVVSMHAAVTPESVGLIGAAEFQAMRQGSIYLNSARAGLHDTEALVASLQAGHLGGAGLDHVEGEILPTDHALTDMDNVVLTPHIGGATYDTEANQTTMVVEDIERILGGQPPLRCANPEVLT